MMKHQLSVERKQAKLSHTFGNIYLRSNTAFQRLIAGLPLVVDGIEFDLTNGTILKI